MLVVLFEKGEKNWSNSYNALMLADGLASLDLEKYSEDQVPDEVNEWYSIEEEAKEN